MTRMLLELIPSSSYYAKLTEQTAKADNSRNELAQLREYRATEGSTSQTGSATGPSNSIESSP